MDAKQLVGGMALPHGVLLMSEERLALGWRDPSGKPQLYTRKVAKPKGLLHGLWILLSESLRAGWRTYPERGPVCSSGDPDRASPPLASLGENTPLCR